MRGVECLMLKGSQSGTFSVPRDWTDQACPDVYRDADIPAGFLKLESLLSIIELLNCISKKRG